MVFSALDQVHGIPFICGSNFSLCREVYQDELSDIVFDRVLKGRELCGVNLSAFETMDPHLLVGLVNTELRNHASSLSDLCKTHGLREKVLVARLAEADYYYQAEQKQFR